MMWSNILHHSIRYVLLTLFQIYHKSNVENRIECLLSCERSKCIYSQPNVAFQSQLTLFLLLQTKHL